MKNAVTVNKKLSAGVFSKYSGENASKSMVRMKAFSLYANKIFRPFPEKPSSKVCFHARSFFNPAEKQTVQLVELTDPESHVGSSSHTGSLDTLQSFK